MQAAKYDVNNFLIASLFFFEEQEINMTTSKLIMWNVEIKFIITGLLCKIILSEVT